jgi:hypothetical protein
VGKGARHQFTVIDINETNYSFNYVQFSFPVKYSIFSKKQHSLNLFLGPYADILVKAKSNGTSRDGSVVNEFESDEKDKISDFDGGAVLGVDFELSKKIIVDFRYDFGFTKFIENADENDLRNNSVTLSVGFFIK